MCRNTTMISDELNSDMSRDTTPMSRDTTLMSRDTTLMSRGTTPMMECYSF
jgi:hypothetical protein